MKNQPKKIKIEHSCHNCTHFNMVTVASDWDMVNFACALCDENITIVNVDKNEKAN